jgi:hypothetical protein
MNQACFGSCGTTLPVRCTYRVEKYGWAGTTDPTKTRMGLRVRVPFAPAGSQVRTCLLREFAFLRREAAVVRGCAGRDERQDWANPVLQQAYEVKQGSCTFRTCPALDWSVPSSRGPALQGLGARVGVVVGRADAHQ